MKMQNPLHELGLENKSTILVQHIFYRVESRFSGEISIVLGICSKSYFIFLYLSTNLPTAISAMCKL